MYGGCSSTKKVNLCVSENAMIDFCKTWYVGSGGHNASTTHIVCHHQMRMFDASFASVLIGKKGNYPEFCTGYCDKSWYMGSGGHTYYPRGVLSPNAHI